MDEILMPIMIVAGVVLVYIPSQRLRGRERMRKMPRGTFWRLMAMYAIGAALIAGGFLIGGL